MTTDNTLQSVLLALKYQLKGKIFERGLARTPKYACGRLALMLNTFLLFYCEGGFMLVTHFSDSCKKLDKLQNFNGFHALTTFDL